MASRIPIRNVYFLLCYAWGRLQEGALVDVAAIDGTELVDLFAAVLLSGTHHLLRRGLDRGYLTEEAELAGVRGRIDIGMTARRMLSTHGRAYCQFDELRVDTLPNQILKTTIRHLSCTTGISAQLREQLSRLGKALGGITEIHLSRGVFRRVQLQGNNRFYRFLLDVCQLVFESIMVDEATGTRRFRDFIRDEKRMAKLFEDFVFNFYRIERPDLEIRRDPISWVATSSDDPQLYYLPKMRTDISLRDGRRTLVIDTKFYAEVFQTYYGKRTIHSKNLYQVFSYLKNLEIAGGADANANGLLLYPVVDTPVSLRYSLPSHTVRVCTVDLMQAWPDIRAQLLSLTKELGTHTGAGAQSDASSRDVALSP